MNKNTQLNSVAFSTISYTIFLELKRGKFIEIIDKNMKGQYFFCSETDKRNIKKNIESTILIKKTVEKWSHLCCDVPVLLLLFDKRSLC